MGAGICFVFGFSSAKQIQLAGFQITPGPDGLCMLRPFCVGGPGFAVPPPIPTLVVPSVVQPHPDLWTWAHWPSAQEGSEVIARARRWGVQKSYPQRQDRQEGFQNAHVLTGPWLPLQWSMCLILFASPLTAELSALTCPTGCEVFYRVPNGECAPVRPFSHHSLPLPLCLALPCPVTLVRCLHFAKWKT